MKDIRIAVLGANGQIASTLLKKLAGESHVRPVAVCRNQVGAAMIGSIDCDIRIGAVADRETAQKILGDCHVVVNCIWPNLPSNENEIENKVIVDNLASVSSITRLIHLSSVAVYGCINPGSTFLHPRPDTKYGKEKLVIEKYVTRLFSSREHFIIRLGHVFGPHQWLSKSVIQLSESRNFTLPFNGDLPSNAIHVNELANAIGWLTYANAASGVYNLAANPQLTWRQLFDWHARICRLPVVNAMSDTDSRALRESYLRDSKRSAASKCLIQVAAWLRTLPVQNLVGSGEVRNAASGLLRLMPEFIRRPVKSRNALLEVTAEINAMHRPTITPDSWFYCDAMPGQYLLAPHSPDYEAGFVKSETEVLQWHQARSGPRWDVTHSASPVALSDVSVVTTNA